MATIADGVSAGFKEKDEEEKKTITDNLVKYIVGENNTSHKVRGPPTMYLYRLDNVGCYIV